MESNVAQLPLSDKFWAWFETNKKPALFGAAALAVVGVLLWFFAWRHAQMELTASETLSNVAASQLMGPAPRADAPGALLKVAASYPKSNAGARALLLAAGSLFVEGKYPEAQAQFEKFTREYHESPFMGEALLGIASCLDAQGKGDQAAVAYKNLIDRHPYEPLIPQAKFALARLYVAQNKPEMARDLLEEVERSGDPFFGPEAGMRVEELTAKYPQVAKTAPAPILPFHPTTTATSGPPAPVPQSPPLRSAPLPSPSR